MEFCCFTVPHGPVEAVKVVVTTQNEKGEKHGLGYLMGHLRCSYMQFIVVQATGESISPSETVS